MPTDAPYSISDLARLTGVSVRTIRYYLAQGLIPASGESGPGAHYGDGHLARLRLVRRLQQEHLPLAEIRTRLAALSDPEVAALAEPDTATTEPAQATSALDYVRSVLSGSHGVVPQAPAPSPLAGLPATAAASPASRVAPSLASKPEPAGMPPMRDTPATAPSPLRRMALQIPSEVHAVTGEPALPSATAPLPPAREPAPGRPTPSAIERSQWERLSLGPNLELHVRRPLGRLEQKRVERLITIARQVLKEEQP